MKPEEVFPVQAFPWSITLFMLQKLSGSLLEAGIDYLTITCREPDSIEKARAIALSLADLEIHDDMIGKPWSVGGYEGFKVGSVSYGERDDGVMVQVHSSLALSHWMRLYDVADNVTRIDLQATYRVTEEPSVVVHRHYQELQRKLKTMRRGPKVSRCTDSDGGYTAYTGRKSSDRFGRIYNKAAQAKLKYYEGCVRYEVQFNKKRALKVSHGVRTQQLSGTEIAAEVLGFLGDRGLALQSLAASLRGATRILDARLSRRTSDLSRKHRWLANAVKPSIKLLVQRGQYQEVMESLGLLEFVQTHGPSGP